MDWSTPSVSATYLISTSEFHTCKELAGLLLTLSRFVQLSMSHETVRHCLLSLAASHLGWINRSSDLDNIAAQHQTAAYSTLQNGIDGFTQANADAVFAASMILSWQAQDW